MNKDEKALENFFENIATDLLSGLLDANDNEQNAHLKAWLDAPFNVVPENLLRHAEMICNHFSAGENGHLLMHGIDDQLAAMNLSRKERFSPMKKGIVGYAAPRDLEKVNALLRKVRISPRCEIIVL
ncbi:hypothetical protein [Enterobacter kobei]|uniref:hypothetical protein n=1 Tax=Enterobacter kobei TaxID=208224 RepID=UPI0020044E54|nr:hypothetical protein [Enterobacter kobei]MCK7127179.1 hypothetical protein [Enterobacter kobei]